MRINFYTTITLLLVLILSSCASTTSVSTEPVQGLEEITVDSMVPPPDIEESINTNSEITIPDSITDIRIGEAVTNLDSAALMEEGYDYGDVFSVEAGGVRFTAPLVESAEQVDEGSWYIRIEEGVVLFGINGSDSTHLEEHDKITFSLLEKGGYREEYLMRTLTWSGARLEDLYSYEAGSMKSGHIYTVYDELLKTASQEKLIQLIAEHDIATVVDITTEGYDVPAMEGVTIFHVHDLTAALRALIASEKPYLIILDESEWNQQFLPLIEALMGARLEQIMKDALSPYGEFYNIEEGSDAYNAIIERIERFFTEMNGGTLPRDKALLSIAVSYLRSITELTTEEISSLRLALR